jgi:hypothetical protein
LDAGITSFESFTLHFFAVVLTLQTRGKITHTPDLIEITIVTNTDGILGVIGLNISIAWQRPVPPVVIGNKE